MQTDDDATLEILHHRPKGREGWASAKGIGATSLASLAGKGLIETLQKPSGDTLARLTVAGAKRLVADRSVA